MPDKYFLFKYLTTNSLPEPRGPYDVLDDTECCVDCGCGSGGRLFHGNNSEICTGISTDSGGDTVIHGEYRR
ncbi:MAG: hypothetical protein ACKPE2_09745, partial [Dolichospermum sp.]